MATETPAFGLYVHWPFCAAKCPYCDFNSHVWAKVDQDQWLPLYLTEIKRESERTPDHVLKTIFFGGGTPSLMQPDVVQKIIEAARGAWRTSNDLEITLEANPTSVEAAKYRSLKDAGVNRVSIGVQATNNEALKLLGRLHTIEEAWAAVDAAQLVFDRSSFDLIYARQYQTLTDWREELSLALSRAAGHLSLYQLTIEDGTAFGDRYRRGRLPGLPDEDTSADMFLLTQELCDAAGLPAYEVSNHATPGNEARHNLIYWQGGDYAGIGPGAHGRLTINGKRIATEAYIDPAGWRNAVLTHGNGESASRTLSSEDVGVEALLMGLRVRDGLPDRRVPWDQINENEHKDLILNGFLERDATGLRLSDKGRPVVNAVINRLLS